MFLEWKFGIKIVIACSGCFEISFLLGEPLEEQL